MAIVRIALEAVGASDYVPLLSPWAARPMAGLPRGGPRLGSEKGVPPELDLQGLLGSLGRQIRRIRAGEVQDQCAGDATDAILQELRLAKPNESMEFGSWSWWVVMG